MEDLCWVGVPVESFIPKGEAGLLSVLSGWGIGGLGVGGLGWPQGIMLEWGRELHSVLSFPATGSLGHG